MSFPYLTPLKRSFFLSLAILLSACNAVHDKSALDDPKKSQPQLVQIKAGQLEYYELGSGSPIVLISGYGMDISSWNRPFVTALSKQHRVIVFNHRKVGRSVVRSSHYDAEALANDTNELINHLHLKKPTVVGISMGGMIAQAFAVNYPQQLSRLVLINTLIAGKQAIHPAAATEKAIWEMPTSKLGKYLFALHFFFPEDERWAMGISLAKDRFMPPGYQSDDASKAMPDQRLLVKRWLQDESAAKKIAKLTLPVLVLNGHQDAVIPPVNSRILVDAIPHAKLQEWKKGGHAMIYQYPSALAESIHQFIQSIDKNN